MPTTDAPFSDEALRPLLDRLAADPRVHGVARDQQPGPRAPGELHLIIATTWDGLRPLVAELSGLADAVLPRDGVLLDDARASSLHRFDRDGRYLAIEVTRLGELKPSARGEHATALLDPVGHIAQWIDWSRGRPRERVSDEVVRSDATRRAAEIALGAQALRALTPGKRIAGDDEHRSLRHSFASRLRARAARLPAGEPFDRLRELVEDACRGVPLAPGGVRVVDAGAVGYERFLAAADAEGFRGDRPLFDAAIQTLRAAAHAEPVFEEGFALPTFDQVEVRFGLGEAVGGCKPPLVPGVVVGVAVTPADELAFWAAPCVRVPHATVACVADPGARVVLPRDAGRDALFGALDDAVAAAAEELPLLLRRARTAHRQPVDDPTAALRALHVPASFIAAAERLGGTKPGGTRLALALVVARSGEDMCADVARAYGRAAGRLLLDVPPADDDIDCAGDAETMERPNTRD